MTTLLEKALAQVGALPREEQDAIAFQILDSLADEEAWENRFAEKRDTVRRMAREAVDEDSRGETYPLPDEHGSISASRNLESQVAAVPRPPRVRIVS